MAVDTEAHNRGTDLDAEERAVILAVVDRCGELTICQDCNGAGWASTPLRQLCIPCRGFGARA